jgi:hypothetical protein
LKLGLFLPRFEEVDPKREEEVMRGDEEEPSPSKACFQGPSGLKYQRENYNCLTSSTKRV